MWEFMTTLRFRLPLTGNTLNENPTGGRNGGADLGAARRVRSSRPSAAAPTSSPALHFPKPTPAP
jgi:hypothetical protein